MNWLPDSPMGIGQVLDAGFRLFRGSFSQILPLVIGWAVTAVLFALYPVPSGGFSLGFVVAVVVYSGLTLVLSGAMIGGIHAVARAEPMAAGEAFSFGTRRALPLLGATLLYGTAVMLGMILLLIPGIIAFVSLSMTMYAVVLDGRGPIEGLRYSHRLVWGDWWRTFAILSIVTLIIMVLYALVALVNGLVMSLFSGGDPQRLAYLMNVGISLLSAPFVPLGYSMYMMIYHDLKLRREGADIEARMQALGRDEIG